jgi:GT2 family glycosyltransferase
LKSIAVILTVHNRKANTLKCLENLFSQEVPCGYFFKVFLTDDGCTDGTPEAVAIQFPSVHIVKGDGTLYWNRGMYKAWEAAASDRAFDFYFWLNDDTLLFEDAVSSVIAASEQTKFSAIVCGATCSKVTGKVTYSGWIHSKNEPLDPNGAIQPCQIVNGNFLLVPKVIFDKVGNLDWVFRHAIGDFDYGLRVQKAGFKCYVSPKFVGTCEANPSLPKWCLQSTPLLNRFKMLYSPLGYAEPIPFFIYERRHFGLGTAIKHFLSINLRALMPQLWS